MSDPIPSQSKLRADAFSYARQETGLTNGASVGRLRAVVEVGLLFARRVFDFWVDPASRQIDRRTATGYWLAQHAANAGLAPLQASAARGILTATADAPATLPAGTEITAPGLPTYAVDADVTYTPGTFDVPVTATAAGAAGNLADDTGLVAPAGIESISAGAGWLTIPGVDAEDDNHLRARIDDRMESLGDGHPEAAYRLVAMGVTGISEAVVLRAPRGAGSVSVVARSVTGAPTQVQIAAIITALDDHRMVARDLAVTAPPATLADVAVIYRGTAAEDAVRAAIEQYVASLRIGSTLTEEGLYRAGASFPGAELLSVDLGASDRVTPAPGGIVTPTVTATMA